MRRRERGIPGQNGTTENHCELHETDQPPAVEMISQRSANESHGQHGYELDNSDESDSQRRPRQCIHLEWQHDVGHRGSERRNKLANVEQSEFTQTQGTEIGQKAMQTIYFSVPHPPAVFPSWLE